MLGTWVRRAITVLLAGCLLAACRGGDDDDKASPDGGSQTTAQSGDGPVQTPEDEVTSTEAEEVFMPDLIGKTEDEAREELGELGIDEDVQVVERESLEEAGTVVEQVPSSGQRISGSVNLVVAKPIGPVPDFVGQQISEVEEWAEERGIEVRTEEVLDDTVADGEVRGTTPAADEEATSEILVQVARTPVVQNLVALEPVVESDCYETLTGEASVNGTSFADSISMDSNGDPCGMEWDFGRDWSRLKGTVGILDTAPAATEVRFEVLVDGTQVFNEVVAFGQAPLEVDVDVSDALRVRIQVTDLYATEFEEFGVWGEIRRIGSGDEVEDESTTTTEP